MGAVYENDKVLLLFIDIAKAFESLDQNMLFKKLECIGVRDNA